MDYNKMNLSYLRSYAKNIGVKSPTQFCKDDLIEKIKKIENGLELPYFTKKGRPTTNQSYNDQGTKDCKIIINKLMTLNSSLIKLLTVFQETLNKL